MKKSDPENLKTRPDLDDQTWIVWLSQQPENKGLLVAEMYRKMLEWCVKKGVTPTRRRLLRWLDTEREAMPLTYVPPHFDPATGSDTCMQCQGKGRIRVNDFTSPCPSCRPAEEKAFWKARGR